MELLTLSFLKSLQNSDGVKTAPCWNGGVLPRHLFHITQNPQVIILLSISMLILINIMGLSTMKGVKCPFVTASSPLLPMLTWPLRTDVSHLSSWKWPYVPVRLHYRQNRLFFRFVTRLLKFVRKTEEK